MMEAYDDHESESLIPGLVSTSLEDMLESVTLQTASWSSRDAVTHKDLLHRFSNECVQALERVYAVEHPMTRFRTTARVHEVFRVLDFQMAVLDDWVGSESLQSAADQTERLILDGIQILLGVLGEVQKRHAKQLTPRGGDNLEAACAVANDMMHIADHLQEKWIPHLLERYPHLEWNDSSNGNGGNNKTSVFLHQATDLQAQFRKDTLLVAQERIPRCVMQSIHKSQQMLQNRLFSLEWEEHYVQNEVMKTIIQKLKDSMDQVQSFLLVKCDLFGDFLQALTKATVGYYLQELAYKASHDRRNKFVDPSRALVRLRQDVQLLQECFKNAVSQNNQSQDLNRLVVNELNILNIVYEFLSLALLRQEDLSFVEDFILLLHQKLGANVDVTNCFVTDLWILMAPQERRQIHGTVKHMMEELNMVSERMKEQQEILDYEAAQRKQMQRHQERKNDSNASSLVTTTKKDTTTMPLSLDGMLKSLYEDRIWQERLTACSVLCITSTMI